MIKGLLLFTFLVILLIIRIPIFAALIFSGSVVYIYEFSFTAWLHWISFSPWSLVSRYQYSAIPLFILMGQIANSSNITKQFFILFEKIFTRYTGGVAISAITSCTIFGSLCGSSIATAATMTPSYYKEMHKKGYSNELILGTLASGSSLGILIPPSIILVIYSIITEKSVASLSIAALIPAIMALFGYIAAIRLYAYYYPNEVNDLIKKKGKIKKLQFKDLFSSLATIILFIIMISGLYMGIFMPTEAASVGVVGVIIIVILSNDFDNLYWINIFNATTKITAMLIAIFIGAEIFNMAIEIVDFPTELANYIIGYSNHPKLVILCIILSLVIVGCFMDGIAITLLIVPIILPIITELDFGIDPDNVVIWFGIITLIIVEIGLITPPFGMNLFVIRGIEPKLKNTNIIKSIKYFLMFDIIRIIALVIFPSLMILP